MHRDLKPGNIMLTQGGAKLMDFGLAKPLGLQTAAFGVGNSAAFVHRSGHAKRAKSAKPADHGGQHRRHDSIHVAGADRGKGSRRALRHLCIRAVLYEMVAGKRPFSGKSQISLASSILEAEPEPVSTLKPNTPTAFEHVVTACLQKNPEERCQSAQDIKLEQQWIAADRTAPAVAAITASSSNKRERIGWAGAVVAAILLGAAAGIFFYRPAPSARAIRTVINPPEKTTLNLTGDAAGPPVLSPDGTSVAFSATGTDGKTGLWVRPMNGLEARALPGTDGAIFPFWSPDSSSLGFFAENKLKTIDLEGGSAQVVCDVPLGRGGAWGPGGVIVFSPAPSAPLMRVSASGGTPVAITKVDTSLHTSHRWPFFLPDGKHFLYLALHHDASNAANNTLYYASLDGRENRPRFRSQSNAVYAGGFLLFGRGDQIIAQAFNPSTGTLSGEPQNLAKGVMNDSSTWHMDASASNDGLLVFGSGASGELQLVWMDRSGKQVSTIADKLPDLQSAVLSRKETASPSSLTPVRPTSGCSIWRVESAPD